MAIAPTYAKAISRRGMARHKQGKYLSAMEDFDAALKVEPGSEHLAKLRARSKEMYEDVGG